MHLFTCIVAQKRIKLFICIQYEFCIKLTGIFQATVSKKPHFYQHIKYIQEFMAKYELFQDKSTAFIANGPFYIRDFITINSNAARSSRDWRILMFIESASESCLESSRNKRKTKIPH